MTGAETNDWVARTADQVIAEGARRGQALTCASGISPSGPIHLGNLREVMVPHLVAEEIRARGIACRHILSWDDFDRLRKVPAGLPAEYAEHIGRPLTMVPDPCGEHASWSEHFKAPLREALARMGVAVTEISQTEMYTSGAYAEQIRLAMRERAAIDAVLGRYRTKDKPSGGEEGGVAADGAEEAYFPFRPYCAACGRDTTTVTDYDDVGAAGTYTCGCGHRSGFTIDGTAINGKLVWKVDWPMRWAYEGVTFEAAGVDHSSPGSSFTVGSQLVREVFGGLPPAYLAYSFVGTSGSAKMSSSAGQVKTPSDALRIMEPQLLRWLYARRRPNQSITVAFDAEIGRLYDEWDALNRRVSDGTADDLDRAAHARASATSVTTLPLTPRVVPFRTLASVVDITTGDEDQLVRVLGDLAPGLTRVDELRPRLDRATTWVTEQIPAEERTLVRQAPDLDLLRALTDEQRHALKLLTEHLTDDWSLGGLTTLVYGIPKIQRGLPLDTKPTPELKAAQRELFALLYRLLVGRDTGPRLPTLLLALGPARIRALLS